MQRLTAITYLLYNFMLLLASPLIAVYLVQRYISGKSRPGWAQRWGRLPEDLRVNPNGRPRLWVHAVSAGEVVAAVPILRELRETLPECDILLSVLTPAGMEMAQQQATAFTNGLFYFPFDLPWVARRVVNGIRPQVFISLESEMWPNVLHELKRAGSRTVMVNGRISDKNFKRSSGMGGGLFRWMLSNMDSLLMQSEADAARIRALGNFTANSERVAVLGNAKFDQAIAPLSAGEILDLRRDLGVPEDAPVFVAGSTRSAEEEAQVVAAYKTMRETSKNLFLIIAPRQINRADELQAALQAAGIEARKRTEPNPPAPFPDAFAALTGKGETESAPPTSPLSLRGTSVLGKGVGGLGLILDTMGELANVYAVATIAFVGNSFPPVVNGGGQNLLQPLAHGKPVFFGPYTATIRSEVALVEQAGVGFRVADAAELAREGSRILHDDAARLEIEKKALELIRANRGVAARYAAEVAKLARETNDFSLETPPGSSGLEGLA